MKTKEQEEWKGERLYRARGIRETKHFSRKTQSFVKKRTFNFVGDVVKLSSFNVIKVCFKTITAFIFLQDLIPKC